MTFGVLQATTCPAFMSFGFSEIMLVGVVALLVFGGNLPDVMRNLGRSYGKLRRSLHEFSQPVRDEIRQVRELPRPDERSTPAAEYPADDESPASVTSEVAATPDEAAMPEATMPREDGRGSLEEGASKPPALGAADEPPPV